MTTASGCATRIALATSSDHTRQPRSGRRVAPSVDRPHLDLSGTAATRDGGIGAFSLQDQKINLVDASTALIELLDQYDCDPALTAAKSQLNAAIVHEVNTYGTHVTIPRGGRPPVIGEVLRVEVLQRLRYGQTYAEIAATTGISQGQVSKVAKAAGITRPRGRRKAAQ